MDWSRLPGGEAKQKLIKAVDNCSTEILLGRCLKEIGLSTSRYYRWRKLIISVCYKFMSYILYIYYSKNGKI